MTRNVGGRARFIRTCATFSGTLDAPSIISIGETAALVVKVTDERSEGRAAEYQATFGEERRG